jgi:GNAT superfamily N-acetyltransferase
MVARTTRSGRGLSYRPAGAGDVSTLVDHRHRMWTAIGHRTEAEITRHDRRYRAWLRPRLRSGEVVGFLATAPDGAPVGSGLVWFRGDQPRPGMRRPVTPYILSMFTRPEWRGEGIASGIVRKLVAACRTRGFESVVLHASEQGRSVYTRLGFERTWEMRYWIDPVLRRRRARWAREAERKSKKGLDRGR